jgi:hypothetical protein
MSDLLEIVVGHQMAVAGDANDVRCKFRSLTLLLTVVTGLNNEGAPTLGSMEGSQGPLDDPQPPTRIAMSALASLLVRHNDIIAIMGSRASEQLKVFTVHDINDIDVMDKKCIGDSFANLTASTNPRVGQPISTDCVGVPLDRSHLRALVQERWQEIRPNG